MRNKINILLADLIGDSKGHYYIMQALSILPNSFCVDTKERKILIKANPIKGILERIRMYQRVRIQAKKYTGNSIIHFLTSDKIYFIPYCRKLETDNLKIVATLHRVPNNFLLKLLLKNFAKKISQIVVLSDSLERRLRELGITNVSTILHPTFYDYSKFSQKDARLRLGLPCDKIVISALGGTRFDKGLDILIDALNGLSNENKSKVVLNIAGREQDFSKEFIENRLSPSINRNIQLKNLSDDEFCMNVISSDWVAVPYRKTFQGVSGPMVEALSQGIPVIVPRMSSLDFFCRQFNGGIKFNTEDINSLQDVLTDIATGLKIKVVNTERLSINEFVQSHLNLYMRLYEN